MVPWRRGMGQDLLRVLGTWRKGRGTWKKERGRGEGESRTWGAGSLSWEEE